MQYDIEPTDNTVILDGNTWLRSLRLPYSTLAQLRRMRVGESLCLFEYARPEDDAERPMLPPYCDEEIDDNCRYANAYFEKIRGGFRYQAAWFLEIGNEKRSRTDLIASGKFTIEPKRQIRLQRDGDVHSVHWVNELTAPIIDFRDFRRIVRLSHRLARMAKHCGNKVSALHLLPQVAISNKQRRCGFVVPFLNGVTGLPKTPNQDEINERNKTMIC